MASTTSSPRDAVIVSAVRIPLTRSRRGALSTVPPSTLLAAALRGVLSPPTTTTTTHDGNTPPIVPPADIQDLCVGTVLPPASGAVTVRMAQLSAGIPHTTPMSTVNRQCSSGLQAVANIANAIMAGQIEIGIGAGVESMSFHPMTKIPPPDVDWDAMKAVGGKNNDNSNPDDPMGCLLPMGLTSENVTKKFNLTRPTLDAFAAESHRRAHAAQSAGKFDSEIVPVTLPNGAIVREDDGIRPGTTVEKLAQLRPAFDPKGSTTAGNSSQTTDGAAAVLLMSRAEAERRGLGSAILAVWRSYQVVGVPPAIMGVGPAYAIPAALERVGGGMKKDEVDVYEINEAFASQASWCVQQLGLDALKVNPNGGAIALGHPLGCTGARMVATLVHELLRRRGDEDGSKSRYGVVSMCIGTGMGAAAVLEVPPSRKMLSRL